MKKDVLIEIYSSQHFEHCDPEELNLVTEGRLYRKDDGRFYVSYDESKITGLEDTRTTIKIDGDNVSMIRTGKYPSQMLFIAKQRHVGLYQTGYGALTIATHTSAIKNDIDEEGGKLAIDYTIEVDHNVAGSNKFRMKVNV